MITEIRKSFKSKSYKIILWVTIFALAGVFSLPQLMRDFGTKMWIVDVNGAQVPYSDFVVKAQAQEMRIQMLRQQYGQLADMLLQSLGVSADPKVFALQNLIKDELVTEVANASNVKISPTFIAEKLKSPQFVQQELSDLVPMFVMDPYTGINTQALRAYLQRMRMSMSDFEQSVDKILERRIVMDFLTGALYVPEFILKERYIADFVAKRYSLMHFNFGDYVTKAKATPATAEQLKAFYDEQNKLAKRYWIPEQREGKAWAFDAASYGLSVDDDAIESYYNAHKKSEFSDAPAQIQVRRILFKTEKGSDMQGLHDKMQKAREELLKDPSQFAQKAKELSEDKETAKNGGLMPFFALGTQHKALDRAAFLLQNDGDISEVIGTDEGVELLQRVAKKAASYKPLAAVKKDIEKIVIAKKFKEQFAHDMQRLVNAQTLDHDYLNTLLKRTGKPEAIALAAKEDTPRSLAMFKIKKEGDYSFYVADNKGYLVQATHIKDRYLPALENARDTVEHDWFEEQAVKLLQADLKKTKEAAKVTTFADLKNTVKATIERTEPIKSSDTEGLKYLQQKGLPVEKMLALTTVGGVAETMVDLDGYLIRLDEIEPFNEQEFTEKRKELMSKLSMENARILAEGFVASLRRNAIININESLLKTGQ